ncbi:MAG: NAD-dependent epimerase/dehydratase family protein, partial [Candidatus Marinimicrobia bacterium]|nr:NAD-dependent epimerase/dehydratase family protein [Candidatus Neomarinimicrobiota bacterium]
MKKFLLTGALGQIGSELILALCERYGAKNVIITDKCPKPKGDFLSGCRFLEMDVTNEKQVAEIVEKFDIKVIYHLAALLSAVAEAKPQLAWDVNMNGLYNILEVAREYDCSVFTPSSIGVFGPSTPQ